MKMLALWLFEGWNIQTVKGAIVGGIGVTTTLVSWWFAWKRSRVKVNVNFYMKAEKFSDVRVLGMVVKNKGRTLQNLGASIYIDGKYRGALRRISEGDGPVEPEFCNYFIMENHKPTADFPELLEPERVEFKVSCNLETIATIPGTKVRTALYDFGKALPENKTADARPLNMADML